MEPRVSPTHLLASTTFALVAFWGAGTSSQAQAQVMGYRAKPSSVRPFVFIDDSAWESADRTRVLPDQNPQVGKQIPSDPRDYLLRLQVRRQDAELKEAYGRTVEEVLTQQFLPAFAKLMRSEMGSTDSVLSTITQVVATATNQLKAALPKIEAVMSRPGGPREVTVMVAPWDRNPVTSSPEAARAFDRSQRFAAHQMGFSKYLKTPTRDYAVKHWIYDEDGSPVSRGPKGNLGPRVAEVCSKASAIMEGGPYAETPVQVPPFVYPVAFLVTLKIQPGASAVRVQSLLGVQPLFQVLDPPNKASGVEIGAAGMPAAGPLKKGDDQTYYPLLLVNFGHALQQDLKEVRLNLRFGVWEGYHPFNREFVLSQAGNAWTMSPYLSGEIVKGPTTSYWTHIRVPVRVHLPQFDLVAEVGGKALRMENLRTSIELFDRKGGKLAPWPSGIKVGITDGKPVDQASTEIQKAVNDMIQKAFDDARTKTREAAIQKFPLAALFVDGGKKP